MKQYILVSLALIALTVLIPWLGTGAAAPSPEETPLPAEELSVPPPEETPDPFAQFIPTGERDGAVRLRVLIDGKLREMDMGTYLVGVVRSEMPASFEVEALKAQAVAARTYTLYKMQHGGAAAHPEADACDDINCCKAYMDAEEAAASWGSMAAAYEEKIRAAVATTDGECVLYEGAPLLAVFHSSSVGATMDAQDVWSSALPYLVSVSSPESADTVPNYHSTATFTIPALKTLLQEALPEAALGGDPSSWFTNMRQQTGGMVTSLEVGGVEVAGNALRTILGLRSACFTMDFSGGGVTFSVTGYGHGVGMSQYGANVLAADGMSYQEILEWYYTGAAVGVYEV